MTPTLNDAIILAAQAHEGILDREGLPYILHVLTVMMQQQDEEHRIAAVLHDVVEDTDITLNDLTDKGYTKNIVDMVDALTRRDNEDWETYIERVVENGDAIPIKLADLSHNTDVRRLPVVKEPDLERFQRYVYAWQRLTNLKE